MGSDREPKLVSTDVVSDARAALGTEPYKPEVQMCFGPTALVMRANAWRSVWDTVYDFRVETLYWFLLMNRRALRHQAELAEVLRTAISTDPKWTRRQIKSGEKKNYLTLHTSDDLPPEASLVNLEPDLRAKYPIPTAHFADKMSRWADLNARVHIKTTAKARHYSNNSLADDADLPVDIEWDVIAWIRLQLNNGGRK